MRLPGRGALTLFVVVLALLRAAPARAWGFVGHRVIEEQAIETLPEPLRAHFRAHRAEISDASIEPDTVLKQRDGREETVKHFLDLDLYGAPPFEELPRAYADAIARYGEATVRERGVVPWTIERERARLVAAMRAGDWAAARTTAAYLGHYAADATMPLHAVSNYDGRATGNHGIHGAIERDLVDARIGEFLRRLRSKSHPARADAVSRDPFAVLAESYAAVPSLLAADTAARAAGDVGSPRYVDALDERVGGMLAGRLARAVDLVAALWVSAWDEAGRPAPP